MAEERENGNGEEKNGNDKPETGMAKPGGPKDKMRPVDPASTIRNLLDKNKAQIMAALPGMVKPERFIRIALTAVQRNPKLLQADAWSLLGAVMEAAQAGLSLDPSRREAALVPRWNKNKRKYDVQFMPQYGGYIKLAHDSGKISNIFARVVYENEEFDVEHGLETKITHKPLPPNKRGEERVGAYAVVKMKDGTTQAEHMWEGDIMEIRDRTPAPDKGPWETDPDEMRKKTVIRRIAKVIPLSPEWTKMAMRDEYREGGVHFPSDLEVESSPQAELEQSGFQPPKEIGEGEREQVPTREPGEDEDSGEKTIPRNAAKIILDSGAMGNRKQEPGSSSSGQHGMIGAKLAALGYKDDEGRHWALSELLGRKIESAKDLSSAEASAVIDVLKGLEPPAQGG